MYGVLSVGRPVVVAADADSETAQIVQQTGCGIVVPPGRPEQLEKAIRSAYEGEHDLSEMGSRAREYALAEADRSVAISHTDSCSTSFGRTDRVGSSLVRFRLGSRCASGSCSRPNLLVGVGLRERQAHDLARERSAREAAGHVEVAVRRLAVDRLG